MSFDQWDTSIQCSFLEGMSRDDDLRSKVASLLSTTVNNEISLQFRNMALNYTPSYETAEKLSRDGTAPLGAALSQAQVAEVVDYLKGKALFPGHIASLCRATSSDYDEAKKKHCQAAYPLSDILNAPHLLEIANSDEVLSLAYDYLGAIPTLYSMNCWWSFAGEKAAAPIAQRYHRDPDDVRFCSLFIYLTDVGSENGPHVYVKGTHDIPQFKKTLNTRVKCASQRERFFENTLFRDGNTSDLESFINHHLADDIVSYEGKAGSTFIEDTYGIHKGEKLTSGERLVFWARYGLRKTPSYLFDNTVPTSFDVAKRLGSDPLYRFVNRLIAKP